MNADQKISTVIVLFSAAVIIAGTTALVHMKNYVKNPDRQQTAIETIQLQSDQTQPDLKSDSPVTVAAGAARVMDTDFGDAVPETDTDLSVTAGAARIMDMDYTAALQASDAEDAEVGEYANLAIAKVNNYVNVRTEPNTDSEVVGKMYDGSVAQILSTAGADNEWFQVVSGSVEGYIKAEFFIYGDDAAAVVDNYVTRYVVVQADRLNVRAEPDITSGRIGYIDNGERARLVEWGDEWSKVNYTGEQSGYVASEYVTVAEEFIYAKSIEEEQAELAALQELQARTQASEEAVPERMVVSVPPPQTNYATVSELRSAVVNYAMQYLGNRYMHGGKSLATGTDCSGFTCYVYSEFGYSLSRTPQGQYTSAGRGIDMAQIQPGDVICYSSNGSTCTHVGLYIGNGQIIHAANSRKGVIISNYDYDGVILGVRSIVD